VNYYKIKVSIILSFTFLLTFIMLVVYKYRFKSFLNSAWSPTTCQLSVVL